METSFEVGKKYQNRKGVFEVKAILGNKINVQYTEDNSKALLDVALASPLSVPFAQGDGVTVFDVPHTDLGISFYSSLGILARHSYIGCFIGYSKDGRYKEGFDSRFFNAKGYCPAEGTSGYVLLAEGTKKGGIELEIDIPTSLEALVNINGTHKVRHNDQKSAICNNEFGFKLFSLGFGMGTAHNYEEILSNIPMQYREDFERGYSQK